MSPDFDVNFLAALDAKGSLTRNEKHVRDILVSPDSPRRTRRVRRMERHAHATVHDELAIGSLVDWSKVDWSAVLMNVLRVLIALLPILLAL